MKRMNSFAVSDFFVPMNGKPKYIRDYMDAHSGPYPVYSASLRGVFGYVDDYDYDGTYLTWVMNGYGGRVQEVQGRFSANRDRGVLVPRRDVTTPDLSYMRFALEPSLVNLRVGRIVDGRLNEYTKIYPPAAAGAEVFLPVDASGAPDYESMSRVGSRLRTLEAKQKVAQLRRDEVRRADVSVPVAEPFRTVRLSDRTFFSLSIGERFLRGENRGEGVPVYSANVHVPFGFTDDPVLTDFSRPSLIWGIDTEAFDWALIEAGSVFSITDHTGRLQLLDERLDPEYVLHALRVRRTRAGFDRVFRASLRNVRSEIEIPVPTDPDGGFSVDRQRERAAIFRRVEETQRRALAALDDVLGAKLRSDLLTSLDRSEQGELELEGANDHQALSLW